MPATDDATASTNAIDLTSQYLLTEEQVRTFRERGFVKLKHVLSPATLAHYGGAITREVLRHSGNVKPLAERNTYQRAFLQVMNLWQQSDVVRAFSFAPRLARVAAELMGVHGVRMYHDQALYKEPGGGYTPWHADQYYWPLSSANTVTAWIPLQATPREMGPLAFAAGSHRFESGRDLEISDESEARLQATLADQQFPMEDGPFDLGEVSFHSGWTFHRAGPNTTDRPRAVMTVIYIEDGIRVAEPRNRNQVHDWNKWMPGTKAGDVVATEMNPVLWRAG